MVEIGRSTRNTRHKKDMKFALVVEVGQHNFTNATVEKSPNIGHSSKYCINTLSRAVVHDLPN